MIDARINIFEFVDYKICVTAILDANSEVRGLKGLLSQHLRCQSSFVSQVLHRADRHFSPEHVFAFCEFFNIDEMGSHYLLLLLQKDRAGSEKLREFYYSQIETARLSRQRIRLDKQEAKGEQLSGENLATFHSHWYYYAVYHLLFRNSTLSEEKLSLILDIGIDKVRASIEMLIDVGFASRDAKSGKLEVREGDVGIGRKSPYVDHVHRNFRIEAIKSLDKRKIEDAHYSRFFVVSQKRVSEIQERIAQLVVQLNGIVDDHQDTKDESILFGLCLDCFRY